MSHEADCAAMTDARHGETHRVAQSLLTADRKCARRGLRLTALRKRVFELILHNHGPVKAYDLLDHLRQEHQGAAPPTVYRALDFLLDAGLIHRIASLNAFVACEEPDSTHVGQFYICRDCGDVSEMDNPEISEALDRKAKALDFAVDQETVEVMGRCGKCRARVKRRARAQNG